MDRKHILLLMHFAIHKNDFISDLEIPISIKAEFEPGMEINDYIYQLNVKRLIDENHTNAHYYKINANGLSYIESNKTKVPPTNTHKTPNITHNYNAPIGNLNSGNVGRDLSQSLQDFAKNQPTKEPIAPQKNIIKRIWNWVMNNPMVAAIIGGVIAMVIGTIILKHYHIL
jgi:hypothetical protein